MTMQTRYSFVPGSTYDDREAPAIVEAIRGINGDLQAVTPEEVLDAARQEESILHRYFEWDDGIAAESFRITQAKHLLRSIKVEVVPYAGAEAFNVRALVTRQGEDEEGGRRSVYSGIVESMSVEEIRRDLVARALREFRAFRLRYHALKELAAVFVAMEEAEQALQASEQPEASQGEEASL